MNNEIFFFYYDFNRAKHYILFENLPSGFVLLYDGGRSGGFSSFKMIGDLLPISGFSSNSSWKMTGIPFDRNARRSSSSPAINERAKQVKIVSSLRFYETKAIRLVRKPHYHTYQAPFSQSFFGDVKRMQ